MHMKFHMKTDSSPGRRMRAMSSRLSKTDLAHELKYNKHKCFRFLKQDARTDMELHVKLRRANRTRKSYSFMYNIASRSHEIR